MSSVFFSSRVGAASRFLGNPPAVFCLSLLLCSLLIGFSIRTKSANEKYAMEQIIMEKSIDIQTELAELFFKTQALAALVIQSDGNMRDFQRTAAVIVDNPAISNILIAPQGVVSEVYPFEGNEPLIGYSLLGEGAGNEEARLAKEKGQLVVGGPFTRMQGGEALVGRLPVYLPTPDGERKFWGLVSVTLHYPEALDSANLKGLKAQGFAYELWRISPDTRERQIIAHSEYPYKRARYIEKHIRIFNADWFFRISPVRGWYEHPENWLLVFAGLAVSALIACIVRNNTMLSRVKEELERAIHTDPLTGLLNRKGLFLDLDRRIRAGKPFRLAYLDLNYFKQVNDTYGHNVGDYTLVEFSRRIGAYLGANQTFARISGDEFILVYPDGGEAEDFGCAIWSGIDEAFSRPISPEVCKSFPLSFSRGEARFPNDADTTDALIAFADKRMYTHKNERYRTENRRRSADWKKSCSPDNPV